MKGVIWWEQEMLLFTWLWINVDSFRDDTYRDSSKNNAAHITDCRTQHEGRNLINLSEKWFAILDKRRLLHNIQIMNRSQLQCTTWIWNAKKRNDQINFGLFCAPSPFTYSLVSEGLIVCRSHKPRSHFSVPCLTLHCFGAEKTAVKQHGSFLFFRYHADQGHNCPGKLLPHVWQCKIIPLFWWTRKLGTKCVNTIWGDFDRLLLNALGQFYQKWIMWFTKPLNMQYQRSTHRWESMEAFSFFLWLRNSARLPRRNWDANLGRTTMSRIP